MKMKRDKNEKREERREKRERRETLPVQNWAPRELIWICFPVFEHTNFPNDGRSSVEDLRYLDLTDRAYFSRTQLAVADGGLDGCYVALRIGQVYDELRRCDCVAQALVKRGLDMAHQVSTATNNSSGSANLAADRDAVRVLM